MSNCAKTKLQELKGSFLGFSQGKARRILEALCRYYPFQDNKLTLREVDIPKERAEFLQRRADHWAQAMRIKTVKLQFVDGLQEGGHGTGAYFVNEHAIVIDADVATSDFKHMDGMIAHEMGHAADRENILREEVEDNRFKKRAISAGLVIGAGVAVIGTLPITAGLVSGLLLGLSASKLRNFWLYSPICLRCETAANKNVLDAGMSQYQLLEMYDSWRNPDGTPVDEYAETILTSIEDHEGEPC